MSDPTLREFQQWMKAQILPAAAKSTAESPLNPQRQTAGEERMRVYVGGYLTRIQLALEEVLESTHQVLGEAVFHELAEDYARRFLSHDYNLSFAGRHLPEYLRFMEARSRAAVSCRFGIAGVARVRGLSFF